MRHGLLATVASLAFISAGALAEAQDTKRHEERPVAGKSEGGSTQPGKASAQTEERSKDASGQPGNRAAESERPRENSAKPNEPRSAGMEPRPQEPMKSDADRASPNRAAEQHGEDREEHAQSPAEQPEQRSAERPNERSGGRVGATEERRENHEGSDGVKDRNGGVRAGDGRGQPRLVGNVRTSTEHASRATDILMRGGRRENANIEVTVGARVPESVAIYPIPAEVLAFAPEYREYNYFIDNDEIVFVTPQSHEIVGMIEYEGRAASTDETRVAGARPCPIEK